MIDTLKLAKRLEAADMKKEQAEAVAEGLAESLKESYVSREYLTSELSKLKSELIWSTVIIVIAVVGLFDGALFWGLSALIRSLK